MRKYIGIINFDKYNITAKNYDEANDKLHDIMMNEYYDKNIYIGYINLIAYKNVKPVKKK
jgi:hypothetical protein